VAIRLDAVAIDSPRHRAARVSFCMFRRIALSRWARFSLRGMALAVLLVSMWIAREVSILRAEREATLKLQSRIHMTVEMGSPTDQLLLRSWLGPEYLTVPVRVRPWVVSNVEFFKQDIEPISSLTALEQLSLSNSDFDALGLGTFKFPKRLKHLSLSNVRMSDWSQVQQLSALEVLDLSSTSIKDEDLAHLKALRNLRVLLLTCTDVTDRGIHHLVNLDSLQDLYLAAPKVTDEGVRRLASLSSLRHLDLRRTLVTAEGLKMLADSPGLKSVVTDELPVEEELEQLYNPPQVLKGPGRSQTELSWTPK
jgi:hypothetical protein